MISITNQPLTNPVVLIFSTARKTCEAMALLAGKSGNTFCRLLKEKSVTLHDLVNIFTYTFWQQLLPISCN